MIFSQRKAEKWREKRKVRYETLQIAKKRFIFLRQLTSQSELWLASQEFKEKYIDTNHPYPPLLNPHTIDYKAIPAELAWEWNLPLPNNYNFIFLSCHGVGRAATGSYFLSCGVSYFNEFQAFNSNEDRYKAYYKFLCSNKYAYNIIALSELRTEQDKFIYLLQKRPFLMLVRDPISNLKSLLNYPMINLTYKKEFFTLQDIDCQIFGKYLYRKILYNNNILEWMLWVLEPFSEDATYQLIEGEVMLIQTDDVKPQNAFETFTQLAKKFHFAPPKESERVLFETNFVQGMLDVCLPFILRIYPSDFNTQTHFKHFDIFISCSIHWSLTRKDKEADFADITEFLNISQDTISNLCIKVESQYLCILKQDLLLIGAIKSYIVNLLISLKEQNELYKRYFYTEGDILAFLKHSKNCRERLKEHLDKRVKFFKQSHPDIVASWKYYNEFEKMCAELDGEKEVKKYNISF